MPRPRLARANKPVTRGGHVELVRSPSARKFSPAKKRVEARSDYDPKTHGQCDHCGNIVRKRKDGTLYTHGTYCLGSPIPYRDQYKPNWEERRQGDPVPRTSPVRVWAKKQGYAVAAQGRIPDSIYYAYREAHPNE